MAKEAKTEFGGTLARIVNAAALRRERLPQEILATETIKGVAWVEGSSAMERMNSRLQAGADYPEWFVLMIENNATEVDTKRKADAAAIVAGATP